MTNNAGLTEVQAAERFVASLKETAIYNISTKMWHVWNGKCWEVDDRNRVLDRARKFAKSLLADAANIPLDDLGTYLYSVKKLNSKAGVTNIVALSAIQLTKRSEDFDTNPHLLNLQNGTLEFTNGDITFREHRKSDMCSFIGNVEYDDKAPLPAVWINHISLISNEDAALAENLQTILGYILNGGNPHEYLFLMHGSGRNGKSVTLRVMMHILGNYGLEVNPLTLMEHGNKTVSPERIKMRGKRLIIAQEPNKPADGTHKCDTSALDTGFLKAASGKDKIPARELYSNIIEEISITGVIVFSTNPMPKVNDGSIAFWERMISVPFGYIIPAWVRDPAIEDRLKAESAGILNWLIRGYLRSTSGRIKLCDTIADDITTYRATADEYAHFLDCCVKSSLNGQVSAKELYDAYCGFQKGSGRESQNQTVFGIAMKSRLNSKRTTNGIVYTGVAMDGTQKTFTN